METWNDEYRMGEPAAVYQVAEVKERVNPETPLLEKGDEIIDMGADFDFDGFQVVRREFFAHLAEPAVTFNNCRFYVNSACLNKFPDTNFVQVLVNRNTKIMALRPCAENARDSFAWCSISKGKRKPKQTTCKLFFAKIVSLMEWNPDYRYTPKQWITTSLGNIPRDTATLTVNIASRLCAAIIFGSSEELP